MSDTSALSNTRALLDAVHWDANGLVPAIAQDASTGEVLMMAWMNREALQLTAQEARAVYWSRSRQKLWRKGEESGHQQQVLELRLDCDGDVIVLKVEQRGGIACHTGRRSCFFRVWRDGEWQVVCVEVDTLQERVLVKGRQVGFGAAAGDIVPVYGPHGNPGSHRDLELLNVATGEIRTVLTADTVKQTYGDWIASAFGDRPISIFFPVLSPDGGRVFFKMACATPSTIDPRTPEFFRRTPSDRKGLFSFDLKESRLTFPKPHNWGHPAWHPDGKQIIEINHVLIDAATGAVRKIPGLPKLSGGPHPSVHPGGALFATDFTPPLDDPKKGFYSVLVGSLEGKDYAVLHTFDLTGGAQSWRRNHPHPVFSPDGKRLYFNSAAGAWSRLMVAERAD